MVRSWTFRKRPYSVFLAKDLNVHAYRIWSSDKPRVIVSKQMHPQRVKQTTKCGWSCISSWWYSLSHMIIQFFVPKLQDMDVEKMWFQQDGATYHTTREVTRLLYESVPGRVISRLVITCDRTLLLLLLYKRWSISQSHNFLIYTCSSINSTYKIGFAYPLCLMSLT